MSIEYKYIFVNLNLKLYNGNLSLSNVILLVDKWSDSANISGTLAKVISLHSLFKVPESYHHITKLACFFGKVDLLPGVGTTGQL